MTKDELATSRHSELLDLAVKTHSGVESVKEEQAKLSTSFALHVQSDDHVHEAQGARISTLEDRADASGAHNITALEKALGAEKAEKEEAREAHKKAAEKWKGRAWAIFATLLLAGCTGLVTHWLSTR